MKYYERLADERIKELLKEPLAVQVDGPKACGKSETARRFARSEINFYTTKELNYYINNDPGFLLEGEKPRLVDEWQLYPTIKNLVKISVDKNETKLEYILTGSSTPRTGERTHSGAGRFISIKMRPMSLYERLWSSGEVSLEDIHKGKKIKSKVVEKSDEKIARMIAIGGWPGNIKFSDKFAMDANVEYVNLIAEKDLTEATGTKRDFTRVLKFIQSVSRNIGTGATLKTFIKDVNGDDYVDEKTVIEYHRGLSEMFIIEDLPTWTPKLASLARLRRTPKRHFVDPSIAVASLGYNYKQLAGDPEFLGLLFESLVLRDLRIYAMKHRGKLYSLLFHSAVRDPETGQKKDKEIDLIIEYGPKDWVAVEVKLGFSSVESGAKELIKRVTEVDEEKMGKPKALIVITSSGFAHKRKDGVYVVPIQTLQA